MVRLCDRCAVAWRHGGGTVVAGGTVTCCHEVPYVYVWCDRCMGVPGGVSYGTTLMRNATCLGVQRHGGLEWHVYRVPCAKVYESVVGWCSRWVVVWRFTGEDRQVHGDVAAKMHGGTVNW